MKICRRCNKKKPVNEFSPAVKSKDGRQSYCKDCVKEYAIERYRKKRTSIKKKKKELYHIDLEASREKAKKYYHAHLDFKRAYFRKKRNADPKSQRQISRRYYYKDLEASRIKMRYYHLKREQRGSFDIPKEYKINILIRNLNKYKILTCELCFYPIGTEKYHIDHKISPVRWPKHKHGVDDEKNLHLVHASCNGSKGILTLDEWFKSSIYYEVRKRRKTKQIKKYKPIFNKQMKNFFRKLSKKLKKKFLNEVSKMYE